jgi:quercetin dioxygenase-like cupin family protein
MVATIAFRSPREPDHGGWVRWAVLEHSTYFRPAGLPGVEALQARFVDHVYAPHSHPTWTVAVVHHGAARFEVDATERRADRGELFVLEPEAVHTGMVAVPEGWAYKVLHLDPALLEEWEERDAAAPRAARWVVFRERAEHVGHQSNRLGRSRPSG